MRLSAGSGAKLPVHRNAHPLPPAIKLFFPVAARLGRSYEYVFRHSVFVDSTHTIHFERLKLVTLPIETPRDRCSKANSGTIQTHPLRTPHVFPSSRLDYGKS